MKLGGGGMVGLIMQPTSGYVGVGNLTGLSGATGWLGLRPYTAAIAGSSQKILTVFDSTAGSGTFDILSNADGTLNVSALNPAHTFLANTVYDQTGNGFDVTASGTARPTFLLNSVTGLNSARPALQFAGAQSMTSVLSLSLSIPVTLSCVAIRTGNTSAQQGMTSDNGNSDGLYFSSTAGNAFLYGGASVVNVSAADSTWHAFNGVLNNASSIIQVDATSNNFNAGNAGGMTNSFSIGSQGGSGSFLTGFITEVGFWSGDKSANFGGLTTGLVGNQKTWWGY